MDATAASRQRRTHHPDPDAVPRTNHVRRRCRQKPPAEILLESLGAIKEPLLDIFPGDRFRFSPVEFIKTAVEFLALRASQRDTLRPGAKTFPQDLDET
jgi:hypothetical protein